MLEELRLLVCGGRDYSDSWRVSEVLDALPSRPALLIQGDARGADTLAKEWAHCNGVNCLSVPAKWGFYGKKAGFIRNTEMLEHQPNLVIAFPGGKGTEMMINLAEKRNIEVRRVLDNA